jgi:hypothetical protein
LEEPETVPMNNRGQIRVLEAFFAAIVVFGALILTGPVYVAFQNTSDNGVLYSLGMNVLIELDRNGELGQLITQSKWAELSSRLSLLLPVGVSYNVTVYNENLEVVNSSPISEGSLEGKNVVSVQYLLVERTHLNFYIIRLQLAYIK